jgi:hypothetical protein
VIITKIHVVFLFGQLVDLAKLVHVELPDEGREVFVPEEVRQDLVFKLLPALDENL